MVGSPWIERAGEGARGGVTSASPRTASVGTLARLLPALLLVAACASRREPNAVTIEDDSQSSVFSPRLRYRVPRPTTDGGAPSDWIEFEATHVSEEFTQTLATFEDVGVDGVLFLGPGDVDLEYDLLNVHAAWLHELDQEGGLGLSGFAGLRATRLELDATRGATSAADTALVVGPVFGGILTTRTATAFDAYARLTSGVGFGSSEPVFQSTFELGGTCRLTSGLRLAAGWQLGYLERIEGSDTTSDLELRYGGPFVALLLE